MNPDTLIQRGNAGYSKQQKQLRDAKQVQAPVTPVTPTKQYNAGGGVINPYGTSPIVSPNAPITSATMAPSTPVTLPTQIQPTAAAGMAGAIEASNKSVAQQRAEALTAQQENEVASRGNLNNQLLNEIMGVNADMTNASTSIDRTEQNRLREESDSLTRQIEMEQESTRQKVNALREANPQGLFGGALQDEMERLQRDSGNRLATLAIQRSAAMRDFATADSIANEQLRLKLEPLKLKSDNLKLFYEDNKDRFNKADDRLFAEVTRKAEQEYKKAEAVETALSETRLTALKSASEQNAPSSVLQAIQKANTQEEVIAAAGKYGGDVQKRELLAQQIKTEKAQQSKYYADADKVRGETVVAPGTSASGSSSNLDWLIQTADSAIGLSKYSGPSGLEVKAGDYFVGDSGYRQLESLTNSLRTNVLTIMTDPSVKKFFGPQMSNADVRLMTAAGTSLNPEIQSPAMLKQEAQRLKDLLIRMQTAVQKGEGTQPQQQQTNAFSAALGQQSSNIQGTSIIKSMDSSGIMFNIPTK